MGDPPIGSEFFLQKNFRKYNSKKQIFINLRQRYKEKKNPTKNEKKNIERERERERERENLFCMGKICIEWERVTNLW